MENVTQDGIQSPLHRWDRIHSNQKSHRPQGPWEPEPCSCMCWGQILRAPSGLGEKLELVLWFGQVTYPIWTCFLVFKIRIQSHTAWNCMVTKHSEGPATQVVLCTCHECKVCCQEAGLRTQFTSPPFLVPCKPSASFQGHKSFLNPEYTLPLFPDACTIQQNPVRPSMACLLHVPVEKAQTLSISHPL